MISLLRKLLFVLYSVRRWFYYFLAFMAGAALGPVLSVTLPVEFITWFKDFLI